MVNFTPCWFSLNNLATVKAVILAICSYNIQYLSIKGICVKLGVPNSASLYTLGQTQTGVISNFQISGQSFIKVNCHNSRTSDDIDMKLGPATKIDKRNMATSKKLTTISFQQNVTSLSFFQFMANLEQFGCWIPGAWSVKHISSLIVAFYLTRKEKKT